jgi:hypothetical protein
MFFSKLGILIGISNQKEPLESYRSIDGNDLIDFNIGHGNYLTLGVSPIDIPGYKLLFSRLGAEAPEWVPSCRLGFGLKPV